MDVMVIESCHSTWIFDTDRMRFCRILKDIRVSHRCVTTEWRPYADLEIDEQAETFSVYLKADRSRLIRSWRHTHDCTECAGNQTAELSVEDIREALHY